MYRVDIAGTNQYFMVENRNETTGTYEEGLPESGIIIWHIDEDMPDGGGAGDRENDGPPGNSYFLVNVETPGNDANASNYLSDRNTAAFGEAEGEPDFNPLTSPGTRTNAESDALLAHPPPMTVLKSGALAGTLGLKLPVNG